MHLGFTDVICCIMIINMFQSYEEEVYNNFECILVTTTLKMATLVVETCR